jgi:urease accessory protein
MTTPGIFFSKATWSAQLTLEYSTRDGLTIPTLRHHYGPLRIQKGFRAESPSAPHIWHQYLLHPPGGIAQNDRLSIQVMAKDGAHVVLTTPGANKWYRIDQPDSYASQEVKLNVEHACLEWFPQESIYFSGARALNDQQLHCTADSTLFSAEVFSLGRPASGEAFAAGRLQLKTQLWVQGHCEFFEQAVIYGGDAQLAAASGMAGLPIFGQLLAYSPLCQQDDLEQIRTIVEHILDDAATASQIDIGITRIPCLASEGSFIILRCRSSKSAFAWQAIRTAWSALRVRWLKQPAQYPRIWST